jgi:hypothetical protein
MKTHGRSGSIDDKSVSKSASAPKTLCRVRNGIHLRSFGIVLVRRGNRAAADAGRKQRLPVPRLPAEARGTRVERLAYTAKPGDFRAMPSNASSSLSRQA